jgi:HAD superfamily phosphatase (TIGR01668 family)
MWRQGSAQRHVAIIAEIVYPVDIMNLFTPTFCCRRVTDINADYLSKINIKVLLLDVDNTISPYGSEAPLSGSVDWVQELKEDGYKIYIVSNNFTSRVQKIADDFGLPFVSCAMKPFPFGFLRVKNLLGVKREECLVVGDQIFTDILGANLGGMKSVLLEPIKPEDKILFRARRKLEKKYRKGYSEEENIRK